MPLAEFEEWWRLPKRWLHYPQAQKEAAKAAWDYLESKVTPTNITSPKLPSLHEFVQWYRDQKAVGPEACYYYLTRQLSGE